MMMLSGRIFAAHGRHEDALERFQVIFGLFPNHKLARHAVPLLIESYEALKRWKQRYPTRW